MPGRNWVEEIIRETASLTDCPLILGWSLFQVVDHDGLDASFARVQLETEFLNGRKNRAAGWIRRGGNYGTSARPARTTEASAQNALGPRRRHHVLHR